MNVLKDQPPTYPLPFWKIWFLFRKKIVQLRKKLKNTHSLLDVQNIRSLFYLQHKGY